MEEGSCQAISLELTLISKLKINLIFQTYIWAYSIRICSLYLQESGPLKRLLLPQYRANEIPKSMNANTVVRLISSFAALQHDWLITTFLHTVLHTKFVKE
jgi:hypothetical protein